MVNVTENDTWIWASLPGKMATHFAAYNLLISKIEDHRIRSVLFYTEFEGDKCPFYDYRLYGNTWAVVPSKYPPS